MYCIIFINNFFSIFQLQPTQFAYQVVLRNQVYHTTVSGQLILMPSFRPSSCELVDLIYVTIYALTCGLVIDIDIKAPLQFAGIRLFKDYSIWSKSSVDGVDWHDIKAYSFKRNTIDSLIHHESTIYHKEVLNLAGTFYTM